MLELKSKQRLRRCSFVLYLLVFCLRQAFLYRSRTEITNAVFMAISSPWWESIPGACLLSFTVATCSLIIVDCVTAQKLPKLLFLCLCTLKDQIIDSSVVCRIIFRQSSTDFKLSIDLVVEDWSPVNSWERTQNWGAVILSPIISDVSCLTSIL